MTHPTKARFHYHDAEGLLTFWREEFLEHELTVSEPETGVLIGDADFVKATIRAVDGCFEIEVACTDAAMLPDIRTGFGEHMAEFDPSIPPLDWTGAFVAGELPPSLMLAQVTGSTPVGSSWQRVTVSADATALRRFAGNDWHFRLLRPKVRERPPVWPRLEARGTIWWPDGDDTLSDRVYTIRELNPEAGTMSFDVYKHPGGSTCEWAQNTSLGEAVGVMGPGGRGGPKVEADGGWLLAGGDETAVPAILRGLEMLRSDTSGQVTLLVGSEADVQPVRAEGMTVTWLFRSRGATENDLVSEMTAAKCIERDRSWLWFAASQEGARLVREYGRKMLSLPRDRMLSMSYWS